MDRWTPRSPRYQPPHQHPKPTEEETLALRPGGCSEPPPDIASGAGRAPPPPTPLPDPPRPLQQLKLPEVGLAEGSRLNHSDVARPLDTSPDQGDLQGQ